MIGLPRKLAREPIREQDGTKLLRLQYNYSWAKVNYAQSGAKNRQAKSK